MYMKKSRNTRNKKIILFFAYLFFVQLSNAQEKELLNFISQHPEKVAIMLKENDSLTIRLNADRKIPQAGTSNLLIAIEYAKQVAAGTINPEEKISLKTLDSCNYFGGNHEIWVKFLQLTGKEQNGMVLLSDVVKGMISFGSDANATYLMRRIGLDAINRNLYFLGISSLKDHDPLYAYQAALLYINLKDSVNEEQKIEKLKKMPLEQYKRNAELTEKLMIKDQKGTFLELSKLLKFDRHLSEVWYEKLPKSTPKTYLELIDRIHKRQLLTEKAQQVLEDVLESLVMDDLESQSLFKRCGFKSGATPFSLSIVLYANMPNGKSYSLVSYLHHLESYDYQEVSKIFHSFNLMLAVDDKFREEVIRNLKNLAINQNK
ncbi:MAG: serine hydrolase [Flammeovirgaceae bacterium]